MVVFERNLGLVALLTHAQEHTPQLFVLTENSMQFGQLRVWLLATKCHIGLLTFSGGADLVIFFFGGREIFAITSETGSRISSINWLIL